MRIGAFGGSFDPVHYGHLLMAELCREQCKLDEVWFLPTAVSPLKPQSPPASAEDRVAMLNLAIAGHTAFRVNTLDVTRGGLSFTVEMLASLKNETPNDELFFLMGLDSLHTFSTWREPQRICQMATLVVASRPGVEEPDYQELTNLLGFPTAERIRHHRVTTPILGLSSTEIRRRVSVGQSIRFQTPRAVEEYILGHGLYRMVSAT